MGGMGGTGMAHTSLHCAKMGGMSSFGVFLSGIYMFSVISFVYPAVAAIPLGATMGVTLYLVWSMIQWSPMLVLLLKFVPNRCMERMPELFRFRILATPDLFATFVTSIFTLCASTYALAGYLIGVLCYACDPIGHGESI